ncbi:hypothetical protein A1O1_06474 [Capronia coronata CBS 617.96]|uniref:Xylanolytic transcriptional activator regulatory domain-containing protein n=1 Tax=Capronia coronata CBS 617.96 TaxID=1182541 RepID=W9Y8Y5_9EURO|nr:uncharacterized protein A1O1_06474 [Capronia coronata CBS 617.96]EXJ86105.1 hypothetical protein A1O1_06474 [Capronia coronata CBS 617.96]
MIGGQPDSRFAASGHGQAHGGLDYTASSLQASLAVAASELTEDDTSGLASDGHVQDTGSNLDAAGLSLDMSQDWDESSLAYFLNDIMLPPLTPVPDGHDLPNEQPYHLRTPRDFLDFGTFNMDTLPDLDIHALQQNNNHHLETMPSVTNLNAMLSSPLPASGTATPIFADGISSGNAAFMRSMWMWTPTNRDHGGEDSLNLSLPSSDMDSPETRALAGRPVFHHRLDNTLRDKILASVLGTCDPSLYTAIASSFPSAEMLNKLLHFYMSTHLALTDPWLHLPTIELDNQSLELVIMMISAGAVVCSVTSIRRLGFALQEAVRVALAKKFETDNRFTRDLTTLQAFALQLQVGLWSGDKRKMELAESFAQPLITASLSIFMVRRAGRFGQLRGPLSMPTPEDAGETLDLKWRAWVHAESYKRLACHLLIHDAQASMARAVAPLLSPAEISLGFPASKQLWSAGCAREWRILCLDHNLACPDKSLSISRGLNNLSQLRDQQNIDLCFAAIIVIYSTWAVVHSHLQLNALTRSPTSTPRHNGSFINSSQNPGVVHFIEQILLVLSDWNESFRPTMALVSERTLLGLHVSFEQVQLFAGKEGEDEARRAFPMLQQWADSSDARKAVWHAGQILRAARRCHANELLDFGAICLYHAGLTFWAYAVVRTAAPSHLPGQTQSSRALSNPGDTVYVWLDGDDCPAVQRFISLNRGIPVVHDGTDSANGSVSLSSPKTLMGLCIDLLRKNANARDHGGYLPLVENLSQLMRDLGNAAQGVLSGQLRRFKEHQPGARGGSIT